jgi:hypothetical protein
MEEDMTGIERLLVAVIIVILLFLSVGTGALASKDVAVRTLTAQGFSNIQITEHAWFAVGLRGCDAKDAARFTAKVTNPAGKPAEVYVCTGVIFKGGTIRVR